MTKALEKARDFIVVWLRTETNEETATELRWTVPKVTSYAVNLRKRGVNLPLHKNGGGLTRLDIAQLNSLINKTKGQK